MVSASNRPVAGRSPVSQPGSKEKPFAISKQAVWEAFRKVRANQGAPGVDGQTIEEFEGDLRNNLYRVWNRMSSGSYFPPPVRAVDIPKPHGGQGDAQSRSSLVRWPVEGLSAGWVGVAVRLRWAGAAWGRSWLGRSRPRMRRRRPRQWRRVAGRFLQLALSPARGLTIGSVE